MPKNGRLRSVPLLWQLSLVGRRTGPRTVVWNGGITFDTDKLKNEQIYEVCLNIFSDFADIHTEWEDQEGIGWSPGYTTQTVLMNLVASLADMPGDHVKAHNAKLSKTFSFTDCGHTFKKPFPPLGQASESGEVKEPGKGKAGKGVAAKNTSSASAKYSRPEIVDYISRARFGLRQPQSRDELYGYGLVVSGPPHRPSLTTPCEFLSGESFFGMMGSMKVVHSSVKEELKFFLPMVIHPTHGNQIKVLKLKPWSEDELFEKLVDTVKFSILHDGYHWSIPNSAAGWKSVMFKYKDMCNEFKDEAKKAKGKGDARAKGDAKVKDDVKVSGGKGKGKVMEDEEEDDEKPAPSAKTSGRGRGRGASRGGRGRGGKKAKDDSEEEESEDDMEVEEDAPKGRGRGRGRGRGTKRGVAASASRSPGPQRKKTRK